MPLRLGAKDGAQLRYGAPSYEWLPTSRRVELFGVMFANSSTVARAAELLTFQRGTETRR